MTHFLYVLVLFAFGMAPVVSATWSMLCQRNLVDVVLLTDRYLIGLDKYATATNNIFGFVSNVSKIMKCCYGINLAKSIMPNQSYPPMIACPETGWNETDYISFWTQIYVHAKARCNPPAKLSLCNSPLGVLIIGFLHLILHLKVLLMNVFRVWRLGSCCRM